MAGTGVYPDTFEEYADKWGTTPKEITGDMNTEGGSLGAANVTNFKDPEKPGRDIANASVWETTLNGDATAAVRAIETQFKDLEGYQVTQERRRKTKGDNSRHVTKVTHTNPDTGAVQTFSYNTLDEREGYAPSMKGKGKEFAEFVANTMSASDAANMKGKAVSFDQSNFMKSLDVTNYEARKALGTPEELFKVTSETREVAPERFETFITEPYKKEIDLEKTKLLENNSFRIPKDAEDQAKANVYAKLVADKRLDIISAQREQILSDNPQLRDEFTVYGNIKNSGLITKLQDNTILTESLTQDLDNMAKYSDQIDDFKKDPTKNTIIDGIAWGNPEPKDVVGTWEGIPITQANYEQLKNMQTGFNATFDTYRSTITKNAEIAAKLPEALAQTRANALTYSIASKSMNTFGWGVSDIITGVGYAAAAGVSAVTALTLAGASKDLTIKEIYEHQMSAVDELSNEYSAAKDKSKRGFVRDVSIENGFSSQANFGKFVMQEVSAQAPVILAMMSSGGYGALTVGLYTGANAGMEMSYEDMINGKETDRWSQLLTMAGIGLANAIPTQLTTIPILRKAKKNFLESGKFGKADGVGEFALGVKDFIKLQYKDVGQDVLLENIGEIATNYMENAIYGNDPTENIGHVAVTSTAFSFAFSGIPFFKGIAARGFANTKSVQELDRLAVLANNAEKALEKHQSIMDNRPKDTSTEVRIDQQNQKKVLEQAQTRALDKLEAKAVEIAEAPLNGITAQGAEWFSAVQGNASRIKADIALLMKNPTANKELIAERMEDFAVQKQLQDTFMGSGFRNEFALMEGAKPVEYKHFIEKARAKLEKENPGAILSTSDNRVVMEATRLWNTDKSRQRVAQNKKVNPDLQVFETVKEAVQHVKDRTDISDEVKKRTINALVTNGSAGTSLNTTEGKAIPIAVIESEAANNKQYVQEHEMGHGAADLIFKGKPSQMYEMGRQIRLWLKENNTSLSVRMEATMQNYEADPNYSDAMIMEEAFMEWLEMVKEKRIDLTSSKNVPLNGMMAQMIQDGVGKDVYDYDFRGVNDFAAFAFKLAKAITDGTIDIEKVKNTVSRIDVSKLKVKTQENIADVKESMKNASPRMRGLLMKQEEIWMNEGISDPGTQMIEEADIADKIAELRKIEAAEQTAAPKDNGDLAPAVAKVKKKEDAAKRVVKAKAQPVKIKLTVDEATERYNDALDALSNDRDNPALENKVGKALEALEEAETRLENGEVEVEQKDRPKIIRPKADKSKRRYSLEPEVKAKIEPKIKAAKQMNDELAAKEKELLAEKLAKVPTDETVMSRTKQAEAKAEINNNPPRLIKSKEHRNLEEEIAKDLSEPLGKANTLFTKLFYDKIPDEAKTVISRDMYKQSMLSDMITMVINEFKPNTINRQGEAVVNDIEDIIFQRGGKRVINLATRLGVADKSQGITQGEEAYKNVATGEVDFDLNKEIQTDPQAKFRITTLLASDARYNQAEAKIKKFWEDNLNDPLIRSFKTLPNLMNEILAEMLGVTPSALTARSGNLNNPSHDNALEAFTKPYAIFKIQRGNKTQERRIDAEIADAYEAELISQGTKFERFGNKNILETFFNFLPELSAADYEYAITGAKPRAKRGDKKGKSTGVPRSLMKLSYRDIKRRDKDQGNLQGDLDKMAYNDLLDAIGAYIDKDTGKARVKMEINAKSPERQTFLAMIKLMGRMMTNEISRSAAVGLDNMTVRDLAAGKNVNMESKKGARIKMEGTLNKGLVNQFNRWFDSKKAKPKPVDQFEYIVEQTKNLYGTIGANMLKDAVARGESIGESINKIDKWYKNADRNTKADYDAVEIAITNSVVNKETANRGIILESKKLKKQYTAIISKRRGDMFGADMDEATPAYIEKEIDAAFDYMDLAIKNETIGKQDLSKAKKMALHFLANSVIKFPEDGYKITDALEVSAKNKIDPFTFKNVDQLLEQYIDSKNLKPVDPDTVKEFSNKDNVPNSDISIYDVEFTEDGQKAVRNAVDTNWGKKANPWCVVSKQKQYNREQLKIMDEYYATRKPTNVLESFEVESRIFPNGKKQSDFQNRAPFLNMESEMTAEEMQEMLDGGAKPGFVMTSEVKWDDVNQDTGETMPHEYQVWVKLKTKQTLNEFYAEGGIQYPPKPDFGQIDEVLDKVAWDMYGTGAAPTIGVIGGVERVFDKGTKGGWKIAFKGGKLLGLRNEGTEVQNWWDRMDRATPDLSIDYGKTTNKTINTITGEVTTNNHVKESKKDSKKVDFKIKKIIDGVVDTTSPTFNPDAYSNGRGLETKMNRQFNKFLEYKTDIPSFDEVSEIYGRRKGAKKRFRLDLYIPPQAEDFMGLLYRTLPEGKRGEQMMGFYKKNLLDPYAKAMTGVEMARNKIGREYKALKENIGILPSELKEGFTYKNAEGEFVESAFTIEHALRVYMWEQKGLDVPGINAVDKAILLDQVIRDEKLVEFANKLLRMNTGADTKPDKNWDRGTITTDLMSALNSTGREELLTVWQANVDIIFSADNMSKLEMAFGDKYVGALKDILRRMKTGRNSKAQTGNEETSAWADFFTNSVGNIMFLNSRSAILQLISATNFINFRENNIIAAGKAIMKPKQYWSDFVMLWNSDFLVDRRDGLKLNVNEADLADVARTDGLQGVIARLLKAGFAPTKYADSLAISLGGATYFRTKYDSLVKKGMNPKEAHRVAMQEFTEIAQESQQSSRPDKISKEQSEPIGRLILAFANTPQQYARIIKRAGLDLINGRGSKKENIAKIMYYGGLQNAVFAVLQQGIFAMAFDSDEPEEGTVEDEMMNVGNSMLNSLLRGLGLYGAVASTLKDVGAKLYERSQSKRPQYSKYLMKSAANISPPIGSKVIKMMRAADTYEWNKGFLFDTEGVDSGEYAKLPGVRMIGDVIAASTSIPADRVLSKVSNLLDMIQSETNDSYRAFLAMGYPEWQMEQKAGDEKGTKRREVENDRRKVIKKAIKEDNKRSELNPDELEFYDLKKLKKNEQVQMLFDLGLYSREIRKYAKEEDRINKIIELQNKKKRNDSLK